MHLVTAGLLFMLVICLSLCSGCISTTVGNTWYENQSVRTTISHAGEPADLTVQVTVFKIGHIDQHIYTVLSTPVSLSRGIRLSPSPWICRPDPTNSMSMSWETMTGRRR